MLTLLTALLLQPVLALRPPGPHPAFTVTVDSAHREIVLSYVAPEQSGEMGMEMPATHNGAHAEHSETLNRFTWPVDGWIRGANVECKAADGSRLSQSLVHHLTLINFDRPQLVHAGVERVWAAGAETAPVMLPATVGVPLSRGTSMGLVVAYSALAVSPGTAVIVRLRWTPGNTVPRPVSLIPLALDVSGHIGATPAYDLAAGHSERSLEFTLPLPGRMLAAGGHLHDYATELRLEEVGTGRVLVRLIPARDAQGHVLGLPQALFGVGGSGRRLKAGVRYRLVSVYDNPTGELIPDGAMGEMGIAFVPDNLAAWPALNRGDPALAADLRRLDGMAPS
ncbi:MAG TPA: hypothetical protein VFI41_13425 [Gemmatimonadales bacterium]|nr:hypothetical protein [Gemmatimonadales bacterium]